ncbi:MAG TPA: DUF3037 domain-containing protein [Acidobacteriaceae bacterium]|nr:DUF3037 domain-containing protein [Acidobacteriaceae bacterium]
MSSQRIQCEFFLVRYVPDTVKNEFVNIGVMLREAGRPGTALVRFTRDWSRVRCVDPEADTDMLEALENEIRDRVSQGSTETAMMMKALEESFSNVLQITEPKACLAESIPAEIDQLSRLYVETRRVREARRPTGRQAIATSMRRQFEAVGVWNVMRKRIQASHYTQPGDPLRIDCGYRPNGVIRMFHAVSLEGDLEAAKVLAFSAPQIADGVARVEKADLELTAIVEPLRGILGRESEQILADGAEQDRVDQYRFGVMTMERSHVRVLTVADLPRVAERAREELQV